MLSKKHLGFIALGLLSCGAFSLSPVQATPKPVNPRSTNTPPQAVMDKFYNYLQNYKLWLGDGRSACSYEVDPTGVKKDGNDRFFLAKISRGRMGTACRGVLGFQIMQVDCKTRKLYEFVREQKDDPRVAGWERYESTLYDPTAQGDSPKNQSAEAIKAICAL